MRGSQLLAVGLTIGALASYSDAKPSYDRVSVSLHPTGEQRVSGVVVLSSARSGTRAVLGVRGLTPGENVRAVIDAGTCEKPGASLLALPPLKANEKGLARAIGRVRLRGREDVPLGDLADGEHVVRVFGDTDLACGLISRV